MNIQFPQILFQMINFGVVAGALTVLLYKPVKKMLEERSARIEEAQKAAEATIAEKKNIDELKKKALKSAEKEAATLIEEAKQDAEARRKDLIAKAKKDALAEVEKMQQAVANEKKAMVADMKAQFTSAVIATAEKVIGSLDAKSHAKLIDAELDELLKRI